MAVLSLVESVRKALEEEMQADPSVIVLGEDVGVRRALHAEPRLQVGIARAQERVPVLPGDTPSTLHERIQSVEHRLLPKVVADLCAR